MQSSSWSRAHFADLLFQKCPQHASFFFTIKCSEHANFSDFYTKPSSPYSLMHVLPLLLQKLSRGALPTSSSKRLPEHASVLRFFIRNRPLATVLSTFCRQLCQIEPRNCGNRDPPSATAGATLPEKTLFSCPRVFPPVNSRVPELLLFSTAPTRELLWLTLLLTWWCSHEDDMVTRLPVDIRL